ncbi:MAG TPA: HEAT repeat domain-containing protein [Bryobacteraceae bacterium]|nr:HEAT repeat domain-containing protein [Bryobacteraceae bacterium]
MNAPREHPPVDSGKWLTDTLPGLLGIPDEASLEILTGYLNHPDSSVRRFALNGLSYWPEESVLRRLVTLLDNTEASDTPEQNAERDFLAILPEILYRHFGGAAVPYLERALRTERGNRMATNIALQLMIGNDPVGFQFAARVVGQKSDSAIDMIQVLKRQFPDLKNAAGNAVAPFVERRASQSVPGQMERK